jgi:hypothetical protein
MPNTTLRGMPANLQPFIDDVCNIIQKTLADAGLQAKVYQAGPNITQMTETLWFTDIDVRLALNISAKVEPIGMIDVDHI